MPTPSPTPSGTPRFEPDLLDLVGEPEAGLVVDAAAAVGDVLVGDADEVEDELVKVDDELVTDCCLTLNLALFNVQPSQPVSSWFWSMKWNELPSLVPRSAAACHV